jgi:hypothetical protein
MGLFELFRRQPKNAEAVWRERLLSSGRITEGVVVDIVDAEGDTPKIVYSYCISGADYESAQELDTQQRLRLDYYSPGQRVTVRYEPRRPGNSLVV